MPLNDKQQRFVDAYLLNPNATQAAIAAGYSSNSAASQGERLLRHAEISAALKQSRVARCERTQVDADWLLVRLAHEVQADVADLYDENGRLKPVHDWPQIWRQGLVTGIDTSEQKIGQDEDGNPQYATVTKIRLADRAKRLEMIGKHVDVQAWRENVHVDNVDWVELLKLANERARNARSQNA